VFNKKKGLKPIQSKSICAILEPNKHSGISLTMLVQNPEITLAITIVYPQLRIVGQSSVMVTLTSQSLILQRICVKMQLMFALITWSVIFFKVSNLIPLDANLGGLV